MPTTGGNAAVARAAIQPKLDVSRVGDPLEREADAVAARVVAGAPVARSAAAEVPVARRPEPGAARTIEPGVARAIEPAVARSAEPGAARAAEPLAARATEGGEPGPGVDEVPPVSGELEAYITGVSGGESLPDGVRERIEPHLGADLRGVRVHRTAEAAAAAASLHARAFTYGRDVFLADGESPADLELMAHETTHVVQQGAVRVFRADDGDDASDASDELGEAAAGVARSVAAGSAGVVLRDEVEDEDDSWFEIPDWILDGVASAASSIPGYTMLTQAVGRDPITEDEVRAPPSELLEALLTWGTFGEAIGPFFEAAEVIADVFAYVMEQLRANDLTFARLLRDVDAAFDEFSITEGIDGNVAIVERYLDALLADVERFVGAVVDRVLEIVRAVVADLVEPLLATPEIAPVWSLATKVFHHDPLRDEAVEAPTVEILADFLLLVGEDEAMQQMRDNGTLPATADWLDTQWATFAGILTDIGQLFSDAWDAITPANLPGLLDTLPGLVERGADIVGRILDFGVTLVGKVLELVKDALLGWLNEYAHELPGFHLLTVILERNPFTEAPVPRTAENLIRGFISLLPGGDAMYEELATSGVIGDAAARITGALDSLGITWELVTETFLGVWDLVTLEALLSPIETFQQIVDRFGEPIGRIVEFIRVVMEVVVTLILELMGFPSELLGNIIANAMASIDTIMAAPVEFLVNMLAAVKEGFTSFLDNIATHLLSGLADWLLSGLDELGIELPATLEPAAIFEFVLQVVGIDEETLWTKLTEQLGEERVAQLRGAVDALSGAWEFVRDVQERGFAAIWDLVVGQLANLWDTILTLAQDWVMDTIIARVTTRLLSMLDPTGVMAVVNSFLVFFDTIRSFVEYLREILEIVDLYVSTIAAVAVGDINPGADMLEGGLAAAIPVALGFLANIIGLDDLPAKVREIIEGLREMLDAALSWLVEQAVRLGQAALGALGVGGGTGEDDEAGDGAAVDPADHAAFGRMAAELLAAAPLRNPETAAAELRAYAAEQEPVLSARLEEGIGLRFVFSDRADDTADGDIDFTVVIAPNTTNVPGSTPIPTSPDVPRVPAPGIGRIGTHGSKPPSNRNGATIHWTESEHIIPFATGKRLWQMVGLVVPGRGAHEDRGQTTIMIYYEAARLKTPADNDLSDAFDAALARARVAERLQQARLLYDNGDESQLAETGSELVALLFHGLRLAKEDAVERTIDAITQENALHMNGHVLSNAERRGPVGTPEQPTPTADDIRAAADTQYDNIVDLVEAEVSAYNILA